MSKFDTLQDWEFRRDEWDARERGMENVYNELAESVLTAPIEDLEEEIRAEGRDPDTVAEEVRQVMKSAIHPKCLNMIWANEAGVSVYIYEGEHARRVIEIHGVVNERETVLATATIEKHNRNRLAEAIEFL